MDNIALFSYDVVDGGIRERHYWIVPGEISADELLEWLNGYTTVDISTATILPVGVCPGYKLTLTEENLDQ